MPAFKGHRSGKNVGGQQQDRSTQKLERLETGVPRLDYILKGGFVVGGTYTVMGPPGSGKTIFANQICFHHIENGGRCIFFTLLAETHSKMIQHLTTLEFFDPAVIPEKLSYVSAYRPLRSEGLRGLLELLRKTIKEQRPSLVIIDGVQAAVKFARDDREFDEFLHELQAFVSILRCTAILLTPTLQRMRDSTENVIVDGVIELSYQLIGPRAVRELTVHKFRGTDYLLGKHEVEISPGGVQIHPRTEIQFDRPPEQADERRIRMGFGIKRLDEMLGGGLMSGTATTLLGSPGTGKTMLGLSFLVEGARHGQHGIYFGFYEPPPRLIEKAERIGIPLRKYEKRGLIDLLWQPPLEHSMDALAEQLLEKLKQGKTKERRRLFIDGVEGFRAAAVYEDRVPRFLSAMTNQLRMMDVTTLMSEELDLFKPELEMPNQEVATVNEGVILLRYVELRAKVHRLLSILKMRESAYDTSLREFEITDKGIKVTNTFESADQTLSGRGRFLAGMGDEDGRRRGRK